MKLKLVKSIDKEQSNGGTSSITRRSSTWSSLNSPSFKLKFKPFRHNQSSRKWHYQQFQNNPYQTLVHLHLWKALLSHPSRVRKRKKSHLNSKTLPNNYLQKQPCFILKTQTSNLQTHPLNNSPPHKKPNGQITRIPKTRLNSTIQICNNL